VPRWLAARGIDEAVARRNRNIPLSAKLLLYDLWATRTAVMLSFQQDETMQAPVIRAGESELVKQD
jgi:hypothetical protein